MERIWFVIAMFPTGAGLHYLWMTFSRKEGIWEKMSKQKKLATISMGSISSMLTGLWLFDTEISNMRFLFAMSVASLLGGELIQLIVSNFADRIGGKMSRSDHSSKSLKGD